LPKYAKLYVLSKIKGLELKKISKIIIAVFLCVISILGVTACQKKVHSTDKIEVTFWTLQLSDFSGYINGIISDYEKIYPNVKIKWIDVPFSEGEKRALAAVMSNDVPDLVNMNPAFAATLASKGALIDLKPYIHDESYNSYIPASWQASSLSDKIFGIPWYITSAVTIYNKKILENSGITDFNSIKTYDDLEKLAPIIKQRTGKFVLMPNLTENGYLLKLFNKDDVPIIDKSGKKAGFDSPDAVKILSYWQNMYAKKYIPAESITESHRASLEKYQSGETAFIIAGANFLKIIKENAPQIYANSGVLPQIAGKNGKVDFSLMNLVVPKKSKHPEIAVNFGLFLTNSVHQLEFCKLAPILPSTSASLESDFFTSSEDGELTTKGRIISAKQLKNALTPLPQLKDQKDLNEIVDIAAQQALLKEKSPEQALKEACKKWDDILKE